MSGDVLMDLSVMADEVIGPLLCNPENQKGWPKIVKNVMKRHVNDLIYLMDQLKGDMSSQIMLPMPEGVENIYQAEANLKESDSENVELYLKTNIEGALIKWAQQIHDLCIGTTKDCGSKSNTESIKKLVYERRRTCVVQFINSRE